MCPSSAASHLHEDALGAAARLGVILTDINLAHALAVVGEAAARSCASLHLTVVPSDGANNLVESLLDVCVGLC